MIGRLGMTVAACQLAFLDLSKRVFAHQARTSYPGGLLAPRYSDDRMRQEILRVMLSAGEIQNARMHPRVPPDRYTPVM